MNEFQKNIPNNKFSKKILNNKKNRYRRNQKYKNFFTFIITSYLSDPFTQYITYKLVSNYIYYF